MSFLVAAQRCLARPRVAAAALGALLLAALLAPWSLYDKLWAVAYGICPQRPGHSLFFGGVQMPIEARETGIFGGFLIGAVVWLLLRRGRAQQFPPTRALALLVGFIGLMGLDGLNAVAYDFYLPTPYQPQLTLRLGAGLLAGIAIAALVIPTFNATVWRTRNRNEAPAAMRDIGVAVLLAALFFLAAVSEQGLLLYPVSFVAIGGELMLMTTLATVITTAALRRSNRADSLLALAPAVLAGLLAVIVVLGAISAGRYLAFGPGPLPSLR